LNSNSKLLPNKLYWASIIFLSLLALFTTVTNKYGFTLIPFPLLVYFFGRGKMQKTEGLRKH